MNASASSFDVVVVGCGIAGLSATATALQAGRRVAVIERAPKDERGGNSRWTEALLRMKSEHEVSDDFETHAIISIRGWLPRPRATATTGLRSSRRSASPTRR